MSLTAVPSDRTAHPSALSILRTARSGQPPLQPLDPTEYATGHALFEARSDQRARLTGWLVDRLACRAAAPTRVLSIGCGDGSVDVALAAALAACGQPVDYVGVEPHAPSGRAFARRLAGVAGVRGSVLNDVFEQARPAGVYDIVLAVHSLYYVADLAATLRRARALLARGGELIVLHAPREPLNVLVRLLAPGRQQAFSDQVSRQLRSLGDVEVVRIENLLDLTMTGDVQADRSLLTFTVQARVPPGLERLVRAALAERAGPGPGLLLTHPVDAFVLRAGAGDAAPQASRLAPSQRR